MDFFFIIKVSLLLGFINRITLTLIYIYCSEKGNSIIMNNIYDLFFGVIIYIIYNEEKYEKFKYILVYRAAIKLRTMSATLLDTASVFFFTKNTMYIVYDTFRLSLDTGLWCTPEFK